MRWDSVAKGSDIAWSYLIKEEFSNPLLFFGCMTFVIANSKNFFIIWPLTTFFLNSRLQLLQNSIVWLFQPNYKVRKNNSCYQPLWAKLDFAYIMSTFCTGFSVLWIVCKTFACCYCSLKSEQQQQWATAQKQNEAWKHSF